MSETINFDPNEWAKPSEISPLQLAFPAGVANLMPPRDACERELAELPSKGRPWREFQQKWFFHGLTGAEFVMQDGIDKTTALRHLAAIQGSFEPKHEHKEAAVAYLASRWFVEVKLAQKGGKA